MSTLAGNLGKALNRAARNTPRTDIDPVLNLPSSQFGMYMAQGVSAQLDTVKSISTLWAAIEARYSAVAEVEWGLFRGDIRKPDEAEPVETHPALTLLERPNDDMSREDLFAAMQQHLDLTGKAFLTVGLGRSGPAKGWPLQLWSMRPDRMTPRTDANGKLTGWNWHGPDGHQVVYDTTSVDWIRNPHPTDPLDGLGPVESLLTDLSASGLASEFSRHTFLNMARPGGVISTKDRLSKPEYEELVQMLSENHKGVRNAGRTAVLNNASFESVAFSMRDLMFPEMRADLRSTILEALKVSKTILGQSEDVNHATAIAAENRFGKETRKSLRKIRTWLNYDILPRYGAFSEGMFFDFVDPVVSDIATDALDRDSRLAAALAYIGQGADPETTMVLFGLPATEFTKPEPPPQFTPFQEEDPDEQE